VALGINGVPFMVFNGTHAVAGATCIEGYTAAITRAAEEAGLSRN
jgi:predicted DsbA family dithiol-disulfide isomerase